MPDISQQEVQTKAIIPEGIAPGTPEADLADTVAGLHAETLASEALALEEHQEAVSIETFMPLEDLIGVEEYDQQGNRTRTEEEEKRLKTVGKFRDSYLKYLGQGYDALKTKEKHYFFIGPFEKLLQSTSQALWQEYQSLSQADKGTFRSRVFSRKDFKDGIRSSIHSLSESPPEFTDVNAAQDELSEAEASRDSKQSKLDNLTQQIAHVETELQMFDRSDLNSNNWPDHAKALKKAQDELSGKDISQIKAHAEAQKRLFDSEASKKKGPNNHRLGQLRSAYEKAQKQVHEVTALQNRIKELEQLESDLQSRHTALAEQKTEIQAELTQAEVTVDQKKRALSKAKIDRRREEVSLIGTIRKLAEKQCRVHLQSENSAIAKLAKQEVDNFVQQYTDENKKRVVRSMERRHGAIDPNTGKFKLKTPNIRRDFATLQNEGPQKLVENYIESAVHPNGTPLSQVEKDALKSDAEFTTELTDTVIEQVLSRHLLSGGKISRDQMAFIETSSWGKNKINQANEMVSQIRDQRQSLMESGDYKFTSFREAFNYYRTKIPWGSSGLLILSLLTAGWMMNKDPNQQEN